MSTELNKETVGEKGIIGSIQHPKLSAKANSNKKDHVTLPSSDSSRKLKLNNDNIPNKPKLFENGFQGISKNPGITIFQDKSVLEKEKKETPKIIPTKNQRSQTELTGPDLVEFQSTISPDVEFYKELAEKRREALNESLKENEELHIENELIKCKYEEQKETILSLEETVEKARKIMELIEPCLTDDDCEEQNEISPPSDDAKSESDNTEKSDSLSEISSCSLDENEDAKVQIE